MNIILWIKNEGIVWIFSIVLFFFLEVKENSKKIFLLLAVFILILIKFHIFNSYFKENLIGWKGYEFIPLNRDFSYYIN